MGSFVKKYNPNRSTDWNYGGSKWRLSRSKIDLFVECPRCFYLDNKLGTARPRGPAFTLNVAVDTLFKKEFDYYRREREPHPIMVEYSIPAVPFAHKDLESWRDNFVGIEYRHPEIGLTVSGAVDDIWLHEDESLIVIDYKATAKDGTIETLADSSWEEQYKRQIGVYQWLLRKNGFEVHDTGYFVYANGVTDTDTFENMLQFETTLVPCTGDHGWIEPTLIKIKETLESEKLPSIGEGCEYCPYREACGKNSKQYTKMTKHDLTFTDQVRDVVRRIPPGQTLSYKDVAVRAGNPRAARAVAQVMRKNYDPDIPCHRVIRADGTLGGYNRGGENVKRILLASEKKQICYK